MNIYILPKRKFFQQPLFRFLSELEARAQYYLRDVGPPGRRPITDLPATCPPLPSRRRGRRVALAQARRVGRSGAKF